jgi:hypothetical protein
MLCFEKLLFTSINPNAPLRKAENYPYRGKFLNLASLSKYAIPNTHYPILSNPHQLLNPQNQNVDDLDVDFLNAVGIAAVGNADFHIGQFG